MEQLERILKAMINLGNTITGFMNSLVSTAAIYDTMNERSRYLDQIDLLEKIARNIQGLHTAKIDLLFAVEFMIGVEEAEQKLAWWHTAYDFLERIIQQLVYLENLLETAAALPQQDTLAARTAISEIRTFFIVHRLERSCIPTNAIDLAALMVFGGKVRELLESADIAMKKIDKDASVVREQLKEWRAQVRR